jgi:putative ABC transport system permease protein
MIEALLQDARYALRVYARNPGFTLVAIFILALSIGANTAIFSIVNAVLLRPLPYPGSQRLVWITEFNPDDSIKESAVAGATYLDWTRGQRGFEGLAALSEDHAILASGGEPENVPAAAVSWNLFSVLGIRPQIGRDFLPTDDRAGSNPVVILGDQLWRTRFGANPGLVGQSVVLDGKLYEVAGVAPPALSYPPGASLWIPLVPRLPPSAWTDRDVHILSVVGKLRPGGTVPAAEAEINSLQRQIALGDSSYAKFQARAVSLHQHIAGNVRLPLLILLTAVGLVLLICCANVASLILARAAARQAEITFRATLGASGYRIARQLLTESILLVACGGLIGVFVAFALVRILVAFSPQELPRAAEIGIHGEALLFTVLVSLLAGVLSGLLPALATLKLDSAQALREAGSTLNRGRARRARSLLVIGEQALTVILLVGAGLMLRSFIGLVGTDPGFRPERVVSMRFSLPPSRYPNAQAQGGFYRELLERVQTLYGVRSAGVISNLPMSGQSKTSPVLIDSQTRPVPGRIVQQASVTPGYFSAMSIRLVRGQVFTERDGDSAAPVAVVNEAFVRKYLGGADPLQTHVRTFFGKRVSRAVIGVVGDVRHEGVAKEPVPEVYIPYWQDSSPYMTLVARLDTDPLPAIGALRGVVHELDRQLAVERVATMESLLSNSIAQPRFYTFLLGAFAAMALLLASVALYGLMSYSVAQQTREVGIRMALGADPSNVLKMLLGQALRLSVIGLGLGFAGALAFTRVLSGMLYGVRPGDVTTYIAVGLLLAAVALLAGYIPARRAVSMNPMSALRYQ